MIKQSTRIYAIVIGSLLLLQGVSTLLFRLFPALDRAFPALLEATQMMPLHSVLHIVSGMFALWVFRQRNFYYAFRFAFWFGAFYLALGFIGLFTGQSLGLHLQSFDHPVHILIGGLGLLAAYLGRSKERHSPERHSI